jgi:hypothetical protein
MQHTSTQHESTQEAVMNVLVNEAEPGAADHAIELLEAAGHRVVRCHERGDASFPCAALVPGGTCPLRNPGVDVAVTVRRHPRARPSLLEDGIACALRARVPVVVSGTVLLNPYEELGAEVVEGEHVVGAVERMTVAASPNHSAIATDALRSALHSHTGDVIATVVRSRSGLQVELEALPAVVRAAVKRAIPRVIAALRDYDRGALRIDVSIVESRAPMA